MNDLPPVEITVFQNVPLYTERVTLDGKEYILRFDWRDREQRWYFGISKGDGTPIKRGVKVVANWPLLRKCVDVNRPPGVLMAVDLSPNGGEPPSLSDFGLRVKLMYFPING